MSKLVRRSDLSNRPDETGRQATAGRSVSPGRVDPRRGSDTRRRIEEAAAHLFTRDGYTATTMQAIADDAGVHVQTIYLAYRTKPALLAACAARLVAGGDDPASHPSERTWAREVAAEQDPDAKLARYVKHIAEVTPRVSALTDMLRATAPAEPDVAAFLTQMELGRREGSLQLLGHGLPRARVRRGLTAERIADIVFAIASPDSFRAFTERCGWPRQAAEALIVRTLAHELLAARGS